jgi:CubicO group peptidase (beta-lactamase class C family)
VDGLPLVAAWGGGSYTPRAAARVGRLLLREGDWDGRRLLTRDAVRQITGTAGLPGGCGMGFWTNAARRYPGLPADACWGAGAGDQVLLVVPSLNLIVVRNGETLPTPDELKQARPRDVLEEFHDPRARILFLPLIGAITDRAVSSTTPRLLDAARLPLVDTAY